MGIGGSMVMEAFLARLCDVRFLRYLLASACALAVDVACFLLLLSLGMAAAASSAIGYSFGIVTHWMLSSRKVFIGAVAPPGSARTLQKAGFVGTALLGLALTTLIVGAGDAAGIDPRLAKLVAIGVSFTTAWLVRSRIIFRAPSTA